MRKIVSMLLIVVAAASAFSIHEAAAQSRNEKSGRESVTHGGNGNDRTNYGYQRYCMPLENGSGRLYSDDMRGWRRVSSCNGYQLVIN